jgi:hypothetical protein
LQKQKVTDPKKIVDDGHPISILVSQCIGFVQRHHDGGE